MPTGVAIRDVREQLFDAAERVLLRAGPSALTSRAVTTEAGCAKGVLHRHFADFDAFLAEFVLRPHRPARPRRPPPCATSAGTGTVAGNLTAALTDLFASVAVGDRRPRHLPRRACAPGCAGPAGRRPGADRGRRDDRRLPRRRARPGPRRGPTPTSTPSPRCSSARPPTCATPAAATTPPAPDTVRRIVTAVLTTTAAADSSRPCTPAMAPETSGQPPPAAPAPHPTGTNPATPGWQTYRFQRICRGHIVATKSPDCRAGRRGGRSRPAHGARATRGRPAPRRPQAGSRSARRAPAVAVSAVGTVASVRTVDSSLVVTRTYRFRDSRPKTVRLHPDRGHRLVVNGSAGRPRRRPRRHAGHRHRPPTSSATFAARVVARR